MEKNFEIYEDINKSTDLDYLNQLMGYIDMDIENIGKDSDAIKQMKARMRNLSVDEMEKQQLKSLLTLKNEVKNRISKLSL